MTYSTSKVECKFSDLGTDDEFRVIGWGDKYPYKKLPVGSPHNAIEITGDEEFGERVWIKPDQPVEAFYRYLKPNLITWWAQNPIRLLFLFCLVASVTFAALFYWAFYMN